MENGLKWPVCDTAKNLKRLASEVTLTGALRLPGWGPRGPRPLLSNRWKQATWINFEVCDVIEFEIFPLLYSCSAYCFVVGLSIFLVLFL